MIGGNEALIVKPLHDNRVFSKQTMATAVTLNLIPFVLAIGQQVCDAMMGTPHQQLSGDVGVQRNVKQLERDV